uniref:Uncharacterized protein n=1 Tax=Colobus angolensis palliatus TaxID=336983 RepID=A0A2K5J6N7_COLAP
MINIHTRMPFGSPCAKMTSLPFLRLMPPCQLLCLLFLLPVPLEKAHSLTLQHLCTCCTIAELILIEFLSLH